MQRPTNRQDLWLAIYQLFGIRLPHKVFTPGHSTPFDFVAEAFFSPGQDLAAWANRSGLKTLCSSIIAALDYRFIDRKIQGRVLSGSEDQARNLYLYWSEWCFRILADRLIGDPGRRLTRLDNGDFEILAASQKRVRGAKVQRLYRDEIDEIDPDLYGASVGMLDSRPGLPARTIDTSTWHYAHGPMGQLVEQATERGIHVHKWNVWESIRQCGQDRHQNGRGCQHCRLAGVCVPKAQQFHRQPNRTLGIAAECCGVLVIEDVIKQRDQWSIGQWEAEGECKRPVPEGLVYPEFRRDIHVRPDLEYDADLPLYRSIDWGRNVFVCLWLQEDKAGRIYVIDEMWSELATVAANAHDVNQRDMDDRGRPLRVEATYCDPAGKAKSDQTGRSSIDEFEAVTKQKCIYDMSSWGRNVSNGVQLIRGLLKPAAGPARLFVSAECKMLIKTFESYMNRKVNDQFIDEPVKPQAMDHPADALRYFAVNRHAPRRGGVKVMGYA